MAVFTLSKDRYGHSFKCGSTWSFLLTRKTRDEETGIETPVDITWMNGRIMYRSGSVDGPVILTLESVDLILGEQAGTIEWTISAEQSVLFVPEIKYFFDVELTAPSLGEVWQSPTMGFKTEQEVTRD